MVAKQLLHYKYAKQGRRYSLVASIRQMPVISFLVHTGCSRLYSVFANQPTNGHPTQVLPKEPTAPLKVVGQPPTDDDHIHKNNQTPMSKKRKTLTIPRMCFALIARSLRIMPSASDLSHHSPPFQSCLPSPSYPKTAISNPL